MSKIILNDPVAPDLFKNALEQGSNHNRIIIYPSIYMSNSDVHVLVSLQTYEAIYKTVEGKLLKEPANGKPQN